MKANLTLVFLVACMQAAPVTTPAADNDDDQKEESGDHHARKPIPSPEEIAKLPEDGGPEYNRLVFEKSPYLLQHAGNPVDWWPWGEAAFKKAAEEDKPVFLSIGYTTCHWCHVMEHESFEDEEIAAMMNEHFIPVKVDREERPDIDEVYMTFTQALTGGGGWPMTVILTPDKKPFFAGTYFPRDSIGNRPGMTKLIPHISGLWRDQREAILRDANQFSEKLKEMVGGSPGDGVSPEVLEKAYQELAQRYDPKHGGFATAPKFPVPPNLMYLLRYWKRTGEPKALEMVEKTLTEMRRGGIWDHLGYGIHRYSTDQVWLLPHFEKMLYDQALVALVNLEAYQATGNERYAQTAREILTYVLRDMTSEEGGFYSAEDADSEGEEGKFYIWSLDEVKEVLGDEDGVWFGRTFNFAEGGNFTDEATRQPTGENIPHLRSDLSEEDFERFEKLRARLFEHREKRIHPQKDDKVLTDWNGLMIAAFAKAGQILGEESYSEAARKAADFVLENLMTDEGRLLKRYRQGDAGLTAHLEDYTFLVWGLLDLYETTFDVKYLEHAVSLTGSMVEHFKDEKDGGFFMIADDAEELLVRSKKIYGGAIPSGNAVALLNLNRLYRITADKKYEILADQLIKAFSGELGAAPSGFPLVMCGLDFFFGPSQEIVISGKPDAEDSEAMLAAVRKPFLPNKVVIFRPEESSEKLARLAPYTETQVSQGGKATAYVCENFVCNLPTTDLSKMNVMLAKKKGSGE